MGDESLTFTLVAGSSQLSRLLNYISETSDRKRSQDGSQWCQKAGYAWFKFCLLPSLPHGLFPLLLSLLLNLTFIQNPAVYEEPRGRCGIGSEQGWSPVGCPEAGLMRTHHAEPTFQEAD